MGFGIFAGGAAEGYDAAQKIDLEKGGLAIKNRLADIAQGELDVKKDQNQKALQKDMIDRSATALGDATALWEKMVSAAPDKASPSLLQAGQILRGQIEQTGMGLSQIPGGLSVAQSALKKFDAISAGIQDAVTAAKTKGLASGAEAVAAQPGQTAAEIGKLTATGPVLAANAGLQATATANATARANAANAGMIGQTQATELGGKLRGVLGREPTQDELTKAAGVHNPSYGPIENIGGMLFQREAGTGKANVIFTPTPQMSVEATPGGGFKVTQGDQSAGGNKFAQDVAPKLIEANDSLVGLQRTRELFKPEYLTIAGQGAASVAATMERLGLDPSPQAKAQLADLTQFQSSAQSQLNQAIKSLSGAAVTAPEEARLLRGMPDPKGDSPTQFVTKVDETLRNLKMAVARYAYSAKNNLDYKTVALDKMPQIMTDRAAAIRQQNPGISDADVSKQIGQYFGLPGFAQ